MTQKQLEKRLKLWQQRLRLQDWDIKIRFVRGYDIGADQARVLTNPKFRAAGISIIYPHDYSPDSFYEQDLDVSIVHELLHIHLEPIEKEPGSDAEEAFIECMSRALVEGYRCTDSPKKSKSARTSGR